MRKIARAWRRKELVVYVLHFDRLVDGRHHYVGLTTCSGLEARIWRHLTGRGSAFTRKAWLEGAGIVGVGHRHALSPTDERVTMPEASARELCPVCSPHPDDVQIPLSSNQRDNGDVESLSRKIARQAAPAAIRSSARGLFK